MNQTYKCASCSAPLEFDGTPMQKCGFCGSTNIAPRELFEGGVASLSSLTGYARQIDEIQRSISEGNKLGAIKLFRETFGSSLEVAKDAVEAMERGAPVDLSAASVTRIDLSADPETRRTIKRVGFALGGSILATFAIVAIVIVVVVGGILFVTFRAVDSSERSLSNSGSTSRTDAPNGMTELLRMGGSGMGGGRFKDNRQIAVGNEGRIYSVDHSNGPMQVFDAEGKFLTQWPLTESRVVKDIAADRRGNLLVVDTDGITAYEGGTGRVVGKYEGHSVESVALTADGRIVAAGANGLLILDADLDVVKEFRNAVPDSNAAGGFAEVALNGLGYIFAVDDRSGEICKFWPDGRFLTRFPPGQRAPESLAVDPAGRVFAARVNSIDVYDENGGLIRSLSASQAFGLAFDEKGALYVATRPFVVKYQLEL